MTAPIAPEQRFSARMPCPVCGGFNGAPRGKGVRCHGYLSTDGDFAHCARPEHAGPLELELGDTFAHLLKGRCLCGVEHGPAVRNPHARVERAPVVASYDYKDATGRIVYQVLRRQWPGSAEKDFVQRRPDGGRGWLWDMKGVQRTLYRLPELLAADPKAIAVVVEGEKDVDNLRALGFVATCNSGGAGRWPADQSHHLAGRTVVVIADADAPGRKHAAAVATALRGVVQAVRIIELAGYKDASAWLAAGGTSDDLHRLLHDPEAAPRQALAEFAQKLLASAAGPWPVADLIARARAALDRIGGGQ
jgi:hypothetical protein